MLEGLGKVADHLVGVVSPAAMQKRQAARAAAAVTAAHVERLETRSAFQGASRGRRMGNWKASNGSADALIEVEASILRNRTRWLIRNNPWASRGLQVLSSNVVGSGIRPQLKIEDEGARAEVEERWARWADSTECDAAGLCNFYGLQEQAVRAAAESGGCLLRRRIRRDSDGLAVPLQLELLEVDNLDDTQDRDLPDGGRILGGIEFDSIGRVRAYHLFFEHPGDRYLTRWESRPVPASEVLHIFRSKRPGQALGVSEFAPAISTLRDLKELTDAHLTQQKVAACFGAIVTKDPADAGEEGALIANPEGPEYDELRRVSPGGIQYLNFGEDIKFGQPLKAEGLEPMVQTHLRAVASCLGISFEALTNDYRQVPFSAARMSWGESERNFESWRRHTIIPQLCAPTWRWFEDAALFSDGSMERIRPTWSSPRRLMLDPVKESQGAISLIEGGLYSRDQWWREHGFEPERMREEIARDRENSEGA